jgi:hypothetical protein
MGSAGDRVRAKPGSPSAIFRDAALANPLARKDGLGPAKNSTEGA